MNGPEFAPGVVPAAQRGCVMKRLLMILAIVTGWAFPLMARAVPPPPIADYGDAPEGAAAYPWMGVLGSFPTCYLGGPAGYIAHAFSPTPPVYFGPSVDYEPEGNGGACPGGGYNGDECNPIDNDAGLVNPQSYTITGGLPVVCTPFGNADLGPACGTGAWGVNIEARLANGLASDVYLNVIVDWNQDGAWGAGSLCGGAATPERIVADVVVPGLYAGPISGLPVPTFTLGPDSGYVWVRLSLTETPIGAFWDGSGPQPLYDIGETEDYLLRVAAGEPPPPPDPIDEFGDAPEGVIAYPDNGVIGQFPTCTAVGAPGSFVRHRTPSGLLGLGSAPVDLEPDGNSGDCAFTIYDRDECAFTGGGDPGLRIAEPLTIAGGVITACPQGGGRPLGTSCAALFWGQDLDLIVSNLSGADAYLNALFDWDQDGAWDGIFPGCPIGAIIDERVLTDFVIPAGFAGPLSSLNPAAFHAGLAGHVWCRFTLTPAPLNDPAWSGAGSFSDGETEDYLLAIADVSGSGIPGDLTPGPGLTLAAPRPNPFRSGTTLRWRQPDAAMARVTVHDLQGRLIRSYERAGASGETQAWTWDGRDTAGRPVPAGLYLVSVAVRGDRRSARVMLTR